MDGFRTYSFPSAKNIVVCGDIHGEFNAAIFKLCYQYCMTDTLLIVAGDCGFGFERTGYYESIYSRNASRLRKQNNWVVMVRGNHDDPSYFSEQKISHDRFLTIPDYSVIQCCNHNILCVGGAISIDREHRKSYNLKHPTKMPTYWPDENPKYDEDTLDLISESMPIDIVVSHTAPSFCEFLSKVGLAQWTKLDSKLLVDCDNERKAMDMIYRHLKSNGHPLTHWYYGHFHHSWSCEIEEVFFSMLDIMEFKELH